MAANEKKVKEVNAQKPGVYALLSFKCNGIKKEKDAELSKDDLSKMAANKTDIKHLIYKVN